MTTTWLKTDLIGRPKLTNDIWTGQADATETYQVYFSDENATSVDAVTAPDVPPARTGGFSTQLLDMTGNPTGLYLRSRTATQLQEDKSIWVVEVVYSCINITSQVSLADTATKWNINVSMSWVIRQETTNSDINGNAITNSAGEPFEEKLTVPKWDIQLNISYYTKSPDWATIQSCLQCSNAEAITMHVGTVPMTFPVHTLKFETLSTALTYGTASDQIAQMNLVLIYRPQTWTVKLDDMGYNELDVGGDGNDVLSPILDAHREPIRMPAYLDGSGNQLDTDAKVVQLPYEVISQVSFTKLLSEIP